MISMVSEMTVIDHPDDSPYGGIKKSPCILCGDPLTGVHVEYQFECNFRLCGRCCAGFGNGLILDIVKCASIFEMLQEGLP
jgi:hypothetical protein